MTALTPKQKAVLDFMQTFRTKHGYSPSQQEIAKHFQFKSLGTVQNYLIRLERHGLLNKTWNARRGTTINQPATSALEMIGAPQPLLQAQTVLVPLLGQVAAGRPIEAIQTDETLEVPASMLHKGDHFVLRVSGDSMIEDGILHGDYVIIKKQLNAQNGQTVVALINNEATIKRYYRRGAGIELHPANPAYKPLVLKASQEGVDFKIEGILAGVIRRLK